MRHLATRHLWRAIPAIVVALWPTGTAAADAPQMELPRERPLRAGFLVVDGVYNTELVAPWDVFQHTADHAASTPGIEVFTVASDSEPITTAEGLRILPDHTFESVPSLDILVVPSAQNSRGADRANPEIIDWVRRTGSQARFVVSLCWGAFILAEAGLLDGRACTTFPGDYETFAGAFPDLDLRINTSFVHDGRVLTSEGGVRSYDAAMYLVELLYGREVARGIGRGLLVEWPPAAASRPSFVTDPRYLRRTDHHQPP